MRPRFQFGLRTLLVVVALFAAVGGYVGLEYRIVQERKAFLGSHVWILYRDAAALGMAKTKPSDPLPIVRRWLGDEGVFWLHISPAEEERAKELFPEATLETATPPP